MLAAAAGGTPLLFRQLFDAATGTFTYLLADVASGEGVLIDPVFEQHSRDLALVVGSALLSGAEAVKRHQALQDPATGGVADETHRIAAGPLAQALPPSSLSTVATRAP